MTPSKSKSETSPKSASIAAASITTNVIPRGRWRSYEPYMRIADAFPVVPLDMHTMNVLDLLCPGGGSALWDLTATSNGGFFCTR